jgi:hypothetical protein
LETIVATKKPKKRKLATPSNVQALPKKGNGVKIKRKILMAGAMYINNFKP